MQKIPAFTIASVALALAALTGCQPNSTNGAQAKPAAPPATAVGVQVLQTAPVGLSTELPGRVTAPTVAEVRPQVRGLIRSRNFTEGQVVQAGQVLYHIDPDSYRMALASAEAAVAKAQATLNSARLKAKRQSELAKIDAVSQQDNEDAQAALKQAEADLGSAIAARDTARLNLSHTTVTAPISGRVDLSSVTPGALVTADQTTVLTTVRQTDPIQVDLTQSSADLLRLKREFEQGRLHKLSSDEAQVKLILEDGSTYASQGRLSFAGASVNTATGAVTLRARFPNPQGLLLPGMYVRTVLETGTVEQGLLLPQQALQRDTRGNAYVLMVNADHQVERRAVRVSRAYGNGWLVDDGLKAGEAVIVEGLQKIKVGDTVQARTVDLSAPGAGSATAAASASAPALGTSAPAGSSPVPSGAAPAAASR